MLKLSNDQLDKIADICSDIGLLMLASVGLPPILDKFNTVPALTGISIAILFWAISLKILKLKIKSWQT